MFSDPQKNIAELGLADGMKVVDLGAGSGFYTIEAAKKVGSRGRVYAVDVQQDLLARIKNSAGLAGLYNIEVVWGNIEKIGGTKLREGIADRVIISNTLFQVEPALRDTLALEAKRILKQEGKLMVIDWETGAGAAPGSPSLGLAPEQPVSKSAALGIFEKIGFVMEKTFDAGDHHYGIIFKRV